MNLEAIAITSITTANTQSNSNMDSKGIRSYSI